MKTRIPLQIVEDRLQLIAVIDCPSLRVRHKLVPFVIDTGSPNSYLSSSDVQRMQIPIKDKSVEGEVDFGGSRFKYLTIPKIDLSILPEGKESPPISKKTKLKALKTTKAGDKKRVIADQLPSILGIDFLREQKLSLHVIMAEELAYLEIYE